MTTGQYCTTAQLTTVDKATPTAEAPVAATTLGRTSTALWRKSSRLNGLRTNAVFLAPRRQCRGRVATGAEQQATRLAVWRSGRGAWGRRVGKSGATGTLEVVLRGAGWSVDLDEVLRSRRAWWSWKQDPRRNGFRRTRVAGLEPERGQEVEVGRLAKAMLQHQLLVQAIEGFFGDARVSGVRLCGLRRPCAVATEVSDAAVPIRARACVLSMPLANSDPRSLDAV